jgi:GTP-binding protein HflX
VIKELNAFGKQTLIVFNKIDNIENGAGGSRATSTGTPERVDEPGGESINREIAETYVKRFPGSVAISARTGEGVSRLVEALESGLSSWRLRSRFRIPSDQSALIAEIHRVGHVLELKYEGNEAMIVAHVPPHLEQKLTSYAIRDSAASARTHDSTL